MNRFLSIMTCIVLTIILSPSAKAMASIYCGCYTSQLGYAGCIVYPQDSSN